MLVTEGEHAWSFELEEITGVEKHHEQDSGSTAASPTVRAPIVGLRPAHTQREELVPQQRQQRRGAASD